MEQTDHSIRNHFIAAFLAEFAVVIVTSIVSAVYSPLGHLLWLGRTQASASGWFLVALSIILALMSALWLVDKWGSRSHPLSVPTTTQPKSFGATITHPLDREMIKAGWVMVEGTFRHLPASHTVP